MARIVKGFHSFTCTSKRLSTNDVNHVFAFSAEGGPQLPISEEWKAELAYQASLPHSTVLAALRERR